jgi:uncharacterized protein (TIGR02246 family)
MSVNVPAEDRLLILDLLARYSRAEDTDDAEGYAGLFTPEGVCTMRTNTYVGRKDIVAFMKTLSLKGFRHHTTQILFEEGDGKRCRVSSYSTIFFVNKDRTSELRQHGIYRDEVVKLEDGQWYFAERQWEPWDVENPEKYRPQPR